jgi:hypothetical protein
MYAIKYEVKIVKLSTSQSQTEIVWTHNLNLRLYNMDPISDDLSLNFRNEFATVSSGLVGLVKGA